MRSLILTGFLSLALFPVGAFGQVKDSTDEGWPPLPPVNGKKIIIPGAQSWNMWFNIDLGKLEKTTLPSNPLALQRCGRTAEGCILYVSDFFSERDGIYGKKKRCFAARGDDASLPLHIVRRARTYHWHRRVLLTEGEGVLLVG
jgi:hypothetical protein